MKRIGTAANASLTSNRSMSSMPRPAFASALRGRRHRTGQHDGRVGARQRRRDDASARREAHLAPLRLAADQHRGRTVDDARRVAGGVDVADRSTCG
jgi:hypothetical protein